MKEYQKWNDEDKLDPFHVQRKISSAPLYSFHFFNNTQIPIKNSQISLTQQNVSY